MPRTYQVTRTLAVDGRVEQSAINVSAGANSTLSEDIPAGAVNRFIGWGLPLENCALLYFKASVNLLVKVNDENTPEATLELTAGGAYLWDAASHLPLAFGETDLLDALADMTIESLYVTNLDGENAGLLTAEALYDPTPGDDSVSE